MESKQVNELNLRLMELRNRLLHEVNLEEEALRQDVVKSGQSSSVPTHPADADVEGLDAEIAIAQNQESLLEQIDAALARIEQHTYGACQQCGREIDARRLDALPYTAYCVDCARAQADNFEQPTPGEPRPLH